MWSLEGIHCHRLSGLELMEIRSHAVECCCILCRTLLGGKGVSGLEKGLKGVELTVVGKAGGVSSSDGRGSDGMAGIGDGGSVVSSSVSRGSDGMSGVGNGGSVVGSNGGSDGSNGKGLLVDVGLSGDLDIDVGLGGGVGPGVGNGGVVQPRVDSSGGGNGSGQGLTGVGEGGSSGVTGSGVTQTVVSGSIAETVVSGGVSGTIAVTGVGGGEDRGVSHGDTGKGGDLKYLTV